MTHPGGRARLARTGGRVWLAWWAGRGGLGVVWVAGLDVVGVVGVVGVLVDDVDGVGWWALDGGRWMVLVVAVMVSVASG